MAAATVIGQAAIELVADAKGFANDIKGSLSRGLTGVGTALTAGVTAPIVAGLSLATKAAAEEEQQMQTLAQVIRNNVAGATDELIGSNESWVTALQNGIGVADSEIRDLQQRFIAAGVSVEDSQKLVAQAYDTAAATGKDAGSVADAFVKAVNGQTAGLSRLGVQTRDSNGEMKSFDEILVDLAKHQGTAATAVDNAAGKAAIARLRFADFTEDLGFVLLPVLEKLTDWLGKVMEWFNNLSPGAKDMAVKALAIAAAIGPVLLVLPKLVAGFQAVMKVFSAMKLLMATNPWLLLIAAVVALVVLIVTNWDSIVAFLKKTWEWITTTAGAVWDAIKNAVKAALDFVVNLFLNWTLPGLIIKHWDTIKAAISAAWTWIKNVVSGAISAVRSTIVTGFTAVKTFISGWWTNVKAIFQRLIDFVKAIPGKVVGFFSNIATNMIEAGKSIVRGLWDGIKGMGTWLKNKVIGWAKNLLPGWVKNALGISSPSKVFATLGSQTMEGFGVGLLGEMDRLKSSLQRGLGTLSTNVTLPTFSPTLAPAGAAAAVTQERSIVVNIHMEGTGIPQLDAQRISAAAAVVRRMENR